jgi:hypothetical protein
MSIARNRPVTRFNKPNQWPPAKRDSEARPTDAAHDVETCATCPKQFSVGRYNVHGTCTLCCQPLRHGWIRRVLVSHSVDAVLDVASLDPSDHVTTETSPSVPKKPHLLGAKSHCAAVTRHQHRELWSEPDGSVPDPRLLTISIRVCADPVESFATPAPRPGAGTD